MFRTIGILVVVLTVGSYNFGFAQNASNEIWKLAGCFDVSYRFAENGDGDMFSGAVTSVKEWVGLRKNGDDTYVLEHLLFGQAAYFPHWYETWIWHRDAEVWTQEVWGGSPGPDAELRYTCTAPWVANRWECHAGRSAKPIRDEDRDYEWLDRKNTILTTPTGWVQNENNGKIDSSGQAVSYELGWITYQRVPDGQCGTAPEHYPVEDRFAP